MAFVTQNRSGTWEIRESRATKKGPRSRTLATFGVLTDEVLAKAAARSAGGVDPAAVRQAAVRAGAPLDESHSDRVAKELLTELNAGRRPRKALRALLAGAVEESPETASDEARSMAEWLGASLQDRGAALRDLLTLGDAFPHDRRGELMFPPLRGDRT